MKKQQYLRHFAPVLASLVIASCGGGQDAKSTDPTPSDSGTRASVPETPLPGVREDVEAFIQASFADSADKRQAARQFALPLQAFSEGATGAAAQGRGDELTLAAGCMDAVLGAEAGAVMNELEARVINTKERLIAYLQSNKSTSGGIFNYPSPPSAGCAFAREAGAR